ncbi:MAG: DUF2752 domain-containing protein [Gemmataceae bacterium]
MRWVPLTADERRGQLPLVVLGWMGVALLAAWDPVASPGPSLCGMRAAFSLPCPACGMTRGASRVLRGDPAGATAYNPLAVPVAALLGGLLLLGTAECAAGWRLAAAVPGWARAAGWASAGAAGLAAWAYLIAYRREDAFASSWLGRLLGW